MSAELSIIPDSKELVRQSTDIASLCREIVIASAVVIQERKYVRVEGWQAIATAHGCVASARDVKRVEGGMVATGEIRRMQDGQLIATAEGFVGEDEPTWYGGFIEKDEWAGARGQRKKTGKKIRTELPKRPEYAIRAMAQTRAISRACRGCFAHVVVLMDAGLSTTPAEEVPHGGFDDNYETVAQTPEPQPEKKPEPERELTEDEKFNKTVLTIRKRVTKERGDLNAIQLEEAWCVILAQAIPGKEGTTKLEDFTREELKAGWDNFATILDKAKELQSGAAKA